MDSHSLGLKLAVWAGRREGSPVVGTCVNSRKKREREGERKAFDPLQRGRQKTSKQNSSLLHFPCCKYGTFIREPLGSPCAKWGSRTQGIRLVSLPQTQRVRGLRTQIPEAARSCMGISSLMWKESIQASAANHRFPLQDSGSGGGGCVLSP